MRRLGHNLLTIIGALSVFGLLLAAVVLLGAFLVTLYQHFAWESEPSINWRALVWTISVLVMATTLATIVSPRLGRTEDYCPRCSCRRCLHQHATRNPAATWLPPSS